MPKQRIKWYRVRDLTTIQYQDSYIKKLHSFDEKETNYDVNDILELYNVTRFIEERMFPKDSSKAEVEEPKIVATIGSFFSNLTNDNISSTIKNIEPCYCDDLVLLLSINKCYDKIDASKMLPTLLSAGVTIHNILMNEDIVNKYKEDVRKLIISKPENATFIIARYFKEGGQTINLPPCLTSTDIKNLLTNYVNSDDVDINNLYLIANGRTIPKKGIDDRIKLLAKKKYDDHNNGSIKNGECSFCGVIVDISDNQEDIVVKSYQHNLEKYTYSKKWLQEHSNNHSLLTNFIYPFSIVSKKMILLLPSYSVQLSVLEQYGRVTGQNEYLTNCVFNYIDLLTYKQIEMYEVFLKSMGKDIESAIAWYFNRYIEQQYSISGFSYNASSKGAKYIEKCKQVFSEMDSIIKQFKLYTEDGRIDQELLSIGSKSPRYVEIPSNINDKYVYMTSKPEIDTIMCYLFSSQPYLNYINNDLHEKNFVALLDKHKLKYDDFSGAQKDRLNQLIRFGILDKTPGYLAFQNKNQINILKDLLQFNTLSYHHYSSEDRLTIDDMINKEWLVRGSSLLTKSESEYFNFYLNRQDFSNGHDLRNKYMHGAMSSREKNNESMHHETYLKSLRLLVALVLKIDDDLSISMSQKSEPKCS